MCVYTFFPAMNVTHMASGPSSVYRIRPYVFLPES